MEKPIVHKYMEAIKLLNPSFNGTVSGNTEDEIVIDWNGEAEISKSDIQAKITEMETAETDAVAQLATDKASGNQKLLDLGLSQAEVDAITK